MMFVSTPSSRYHSRCSASGVEALRIRIVHPTHMLFYFQVGGYESAKAIRSMEL